MFSLSLSCLSLPVSLISCLWFRLVFLKSLSQSDWQILGVNWGQAEGLLRAILAVSESYPETRIAEEDLLVRVFESQENFPGSP